MRLGLVSTSRIPSSSKIRASYTSCSDLGIEGSNRDSNAKLPFAAPRAPPWPPHAAWPNSRPRCGALSIQQELPHGLAPPAAHGGPKRQPLRRSPRGALHAVSVQRSTHLRSASTEKAPPAPKVMKHEAPMVLVKTEAPVQAKSATPQMAPSPATLADSRTASPAKGSSPAPASISPTPNGATKAPHQHREHGHHKTKTDKEKKHHHKHHRRSKHSEPTVPIATAPVAFVPPVGSSPLRSQESLTRVRQYQVRSEVEDPQSKAILAVTEQRRKQLDEERMQSLRHEERFMKRRDTKDVLPPPAVLPPEHLADRLVTLAAALRHSLAQLVRVIKDVRVLRAAFASRTVSARDPTNQIWTGGGGPCDRRGH